METLSTQIVNLDSKISKLNLKREILWDLHEQELERNDKIYDLRWRGWSYHEISKLLKVSRPTITKICNDIVDNLESDIKFDKVKNGIKTKTPKLKRFTE